MISKWEDLPSGMATSDAPFYEKLAWYSNLDDRYRVEVQRTKPYEGRLVIYDHEKNDQEIYTEIVFISYDALFGPDFQDIKDWSEVAMNFVDEKYKPHD